MWAVPTRRTARSHRHCSSPPSQPDHLQPARDLLRRDQVALARARTDLARPLPGFRGGDVALPKRPGAALPRPHRVDGAAGGLVVEDAVAAGLLAQRPAAVGAASVQAGDFLHGLAEELCDGRDFRVVHPDVARLAGAAVAAARAAEAQAVAVPGFRHAVAVPFATMGR